jgi:hypothetical protein
MIAHCSAIYMTRVAGCGFKLRPRDIYHLERADLAVTLEVEKWEACIFENANGVNNLLVPAIPPLHNHHACL